MRNLVVEKALFLKREKKRFALVNPEVCDLCGSRHPTKKSLAKHRLEKHKVDALGALFARPK